MRWSAVATALGATVAAAAAAGFLWACWRNGAVGQPDVRLDEWHHLYLGLGIAVAGGVTRRPLLLCLGAAIAADDAWQHLLQVSGAWTYASPLHALFGRYLWPLTVVQRLTAWLNALFA